MAGAVDLASSQPHRRQTHLSGLGVPRSAFAFRFCASIHSARSWPGLGGGGGSSTRTS